MLVKPLVPSQLFSLIYTGAADGIDYGSSKTLEGLVEDLVYDERADRRCDVRRSIVVLEAKIAAANADSAVEADALGISLEARLFAAYIIESLWHLRVHDAKSARASLNKAIQLSSRKECSINRVVVLESQGLVSSLVTELEDILARYEPCLFGGI